MSKVLFISGSIGMGHVTRDLAIANEFRKLRPDDEIVWLAGEPALTILKNEGEKLLPESGDYNRDTLTAASSSSGFNLDLAQHLMKSGNVWKMAYRQFEKIVEREKPDLVVGDEAYEIAVQVANGKYIAKPKTIIIFDFVKSYPMSHKPKEMLVIWMVNRYWNKVLHLPPWKKIPTAFVGEPEDIPDEKLGIFMSNARETAKGMTFLGDILRFDPDDYLDQRSVKDKLGYGKDPLIVVSIGGTAIGRSLLDLCAKTYPLLKQDIPKLRMVLVGGPMLDPTTVLVPQGVEVRGYVPKLYEHFAASDLSIVQAGGTTLAELIALKRPFLYFPLEGHYEQQICVAGKAKRHNAGVRMEFSQTSPEKLAETIKQNIDTKVNYRPVQIGGEKKMAELMNTILNS